MKTFQCKTQLITGPGSTARLKDFQVGKLLLVTDPYFMESGQAQQIADLACPTALSVFHKVTPDPSVELVAEGTAQVKSFDADTILALGGGSAMDCAKAIAYFSGRKAKLIAVPTTSGSGAEVTDFAILTSGQVKHPLIDEKLRPDVAILDGALLTKLPKHLIADAGFDVLSHALESLVATGAGDITDALAADAFTAVFAHLGSSYRGDTGVRQRIHTAAAMAGMAFSQAGLGLCHAMSHALGGQFHIPHGRLNAILLPEVVRCNAYKAGSKYAKLARQAGLGGSADSLAVRNLINGLLRLRRELQLPETLAQAGISPAKVRQAGGELVKAALQDPCCKTNPIPVEDFMVRRILEAVTGRV